MADKFIASPLKRHYFKCTPLASLAPLLFLSPLFAFACPLRCTSCSSPVRFFLPARVVVAVVVVVVVCRHTLRLALGTSVIYSARVTVRI